MAGERPNPTLRVLPAGTAPAGRLSEQITRNESALRVAVDGEIFVAGVPHSQLQDWNRVLHKDYSKTPSYRALLHAALLLTRQRVIDVRVTGLPMSQYQDKLKRTELNEQLQDRHTVTADDPAIEVKKVRGGALAVSRVHGRPGQGIWRTAEDAAVGADVGHRSRIFLTGLDAGSRGAMTATIVGNQSTSEFDDSGRHRQTTESRVWNEVG